MRLHEYVAGSIWLLSYPIALAGVRFEARMTVVRMRDGALVVHSPGPLDDAVRSEIDALGRVAVIVAPGNFHHLHVAACQRAYPDAATWICPGVERKQPTLRFDGILGERLPVSMEAEFEQTFVRGRFMSEVAMLHRPTRTLLLVDLIERFGDATPNLSWLVRASWKLLGTWNEPTLAPEYRFGWADRAATRAALERILAWDFDRAVIAHGDLIDDDPKAVARRAWRNVLS